MTASAVLAAMLPFPARRLVAALCALWLAISIAEPGLLHACPMHGAAATATPVDAPAQGRHVHGAADADGTHPHAPRDGAPLCVCIGDCAAPTTAGVAAARVTLATVAVVDAADPGLPDHASVHVARALLLPFANGPPTLPPSPRA